MQTVSRRKANAGANLSPVDFEKARIEHAQAQKEEARLLGEVTQRKREAGIAEQVIPALLSEHMRSSSFDPVVNRSGSFISFDTRVPYLLRQFSCSTLVIRSLTHAGAR